MEIAHASRHDSLQKSGHPGAVVDGNSERLRRRDAGPGNMKLTFLGTRGYIATCSSAHRFHSALLATYRSTRLMIDCGADWSGKVDAIAPDALLLTHAHPDHAFGLKMGVRCPVHASEDTWRAIGAFPISHRRTVVARHPFAIGAVEVEAFQVIHSIRAPALGYRLRAGTVSIFYVPDLIDIVDRQDALRDVRLYIGDGASLVRPLVRRKGNQLFGHTTVRAQIGWCQRAGVKRALFTHCGSQIVEGEAASIEAMVWALGTEQGVDAAIAHDGMEVRLVGRSSPAAKRVGQPACPA